MSSVHYKFSSKLNYDTVTFEGLHISLCALKRQIMGREKLKAASCDLQISNAQTKEEYTDDTTLIPKNSSVIVRRIPVGGVKATSKTSVRTPDSHKILETAFRSRTGPESGTSKATANLAEANASEEDKIKAMMTQSCRDYDPINYVKKPLGPLPPSYTCFRCGKPGHYIRNCPRNGGEKMESLPRLKRSTGIPRSFMMEVKDPNTKGAMLTNTGKYAIPTINAEAYARGKKEKPPFLPEEPSSTSSDDPVPDHLLCLICKDIMTDAVLIPCCGNSYCDECIRTALLESEEHTCPTCHQTDVSPDALVANKFLRQAVNNFKNGTGYGKWIQQQQPPPPPPSPPLLRQTVTRDLQPLLRPTISREQEPLMIPLATLASHSAAALPSLAPGPSPVAAGLPVSPSSVVVSDLPAAVPLSLRAVKPGGPLCDADTVVPPAALVTAAELSKSSCLSISSLLQEKGYQVPVLREQPLLSVLGRQGQSMPTTGHPMRARTIRSAGGRPGWGLRSNRGCLRSERTQRTWAPTLPASTPLFLPVPPPPLCPPPPQALPLPRGVAPPQVPPQFPPGQPPSSVYTVPAPGYPPAPATVPPPRASTAVPTAHSSTIPTTRAPPLSREEFYREHQRLKEEEKKKSKLDEFASAFAEELMEHKQLQKERRHSFSRSRSPYSASAYSGSLYTYRSKSRLGSSCSRSYSRSFSCSHSRSYSPSPAYPRRGKGTSCNYRSRSRSHGYHRSRSRSPPYRRYHSRSRSPVFRGHRSTAKNSAPNRGKKSDHDGNRAHSSCKRRDEKSELARRKDSPSPNRESTSVQKSKPRDERAEPSTKGAGDAQRSSCSPPRERKQSDRKAAHDSKRTLEEHKPLDKKSEKEKHVPEVKSNKEREPGGNKPPLRQESPDVKNEKENVTGQNDESVIEPKPQVSSSSRLFSGVTRERDEAAFVQDCKESDSESRCRGFGSKPPTSNQDTNVSTQGEEAAGKNPEEAKEKAVDKVKEDPAAPAAADQPEASRSQSQSSPRVRRGRSQSPSESQPRSHSGSASSGEHQGSKAKRKKKEKQQHTKHKNHKKHKKHIGNKRELGKRQNHKHRK